MGVKVSGWCKWHVSTGTTAFYIQINVAFSAEESVKLYDNCLFLFMLVTTIRFYNIKWQLFSLSLLYANSIREFYATFRQIVEEKMTRYLLTECHKSFFISHSILQSFIPI